MSLVKPIDSQMKMLEFIRFAKKPRFNSRIALGPRAGKKVRRIGVKEFSNSGASWGLNGECCGNYGSFSVHANTHFRTNEREELKGLLRYVARSSVSLECLSETDDGNIRYELKSPWSDGTEVVIYSKLEFLEKLAALVPYPHKNLVIYSGCLAPNHKIRAKIVPCSSNSEASDEKPEGNYSRYIPWVELLR